MEKELKQEDEKWRSTIKNISIHIERLQNLKLKNKKGK